EYAVRQTPVSPYAPWRASSSRYRSTRPASTSIKPDLALERHRVRRHRRPRRPAQLEREAEECELVLLRLRDLLQVHDLDDLRPGGREHVGVHREEHVL